MKTTALTRVLVPALAFALALASCQEPRTPLSPDAPQASAPEAAAYHQVKGEDGRMYTLVHDRIPSDILDLDVSRLIGVDGGQISLAGHTLTVPAGAVTAPTLFTLTLLTDGHVHVDLSATVTDLLGNVIDVGSKGFHKPVTITLTYARSTNVPADKEPSLVILRDPEGKQKSHKPMPSRVDAANKTVSAQLSSFSGYCMAY